MLKLGEVNKQALKLKGYIRIAVKGRVCYSRWMCNILSMNLSR